jgi:hypothetical protein
MREQPSRWWKEEVVPLESVRFAVGLAMLSRPRRSAHVLGSQEPSPLGLWVLRVLGLRNLIQALALRDAVPRAHLLGAAVDATHGLSALVLARVSRERRTAALRNAALAQLLCASELVVSQRQGRRGSR